MLNFLISGIYTSVFSIILSISSLLNGQTISFSFPIEIIPTPLLLKILKSLSLSSQSASRRTASILLSSNSFTLAFLFIFIRMGISLKISSKKFSTLAFPLKRMLILL